MRARGARGDGVEPQGPSPALAYRVARGHERDLCARGLPEMRSVEARGRVGSETLRKWPTFAAVLSCTNRPSSLTPLPSEGGHSIYARARAMDLREG